MKSFTTAIMDCLILPLQVFHFNSFHIQRNNQWANEEKKAQNNSKISNENVFVCLFFLSCRIKLKIGNDKWLLLIRNMQKNINVVVLN